MPRYLQLVRVSRIREAPPAFTESVNVPGDLLVPFLYPWAECDREHFLVAHLDTKNRLRGIEDTAIGTDSTALIHPSCVFRAALLASACAIICAHNHPSGDLTPSTEDRHLVTRLVHAGAILGVSLLDFLIFAPRTKEGVVPFVSFSQRGFL